MAVRICFQGLLFFALCLVLVPLRVAGQAPAPGSLHGEVSDPSGAVIPGAQIVAQEGSESFTTKSGRDGAYTFRSLAPGSYTVIATARGFAALTVDDVTIAPGQVRELKLPLTIEASHEEVTVTGQNQGVSVNPDQNASAMVIRGSDLNALSDDPDELQNELQALAGPSAGPNGGEIYIDGFSGGQLPPKSSILEIRVNQNPFSAEFDRIGYGRIEIITKPGTQKLHGSISSFGSDAGLNTANPLIPYQPSYYLYGINGNVNGPLTKNSSYFLNFFRMSRQNQSIVDAVNPQNTSVNLQEAYPNPSGITVANTRVDFQVGRNTLTVRDNFFRSAVTGSGVGTLSLPSQASNSLNQENTIQVGDTILVNEALVNEIHAQWRRMRNSQSAAVPGPTVTVQGAFTDGGNSSGTVEDHQDDFEIQDKSTATAGKHTLRFGANMRIYRDANYSTSGENGTYMYDSLANYQSGTPTLYSVTQITNPLVRATVVDGALYFQDDLKINPNFVLGLGLRYEAQNWIADHNDWAPRIAFAWSPGHTGTAPAKTVVRGGYGWFYNRFTVPNSFNSFAGTPYVIQALHDNLVNQRSYTTVFDPNSTSAAATVPTYHTIDPHFHAAIDMQSGIGVDRQITKLITGNITYLYTQGVHQYLSNNVTAPAFDLATYTITGATPQLYDYQFQSGGIYKQNQIIASVSARLKHLTMNTNYTYGTAKSDTQGVNSFPSVSADPGLDYGRATFGIRHQLVWIGSYAAPKAFTIAALIAARSGVPYNLTIGSDLTGNNQFNARPTYGPSGACDQNGGSTQYVATQYGCLDTDPVNTGERMMPYGAGIGPANSILLMRASKVIGIGPRLKTASENDNSTIQSSNSVQGRGLSGGGAPIHLDAAAPRKYSLTIAVGANNVFNQVNLAPPNGVLTSRLFNQTQSVAGNGPFGSPLPGNRTVFLQSNFSF